MVTQCFDQIYDLMEQSFPKKEFRGYAEQKKLLSLPPYHMLIERNEQQEVIGFLAGWEFEHFRFIEHIAVSPTLRGGGVGKRLVRRFLAQSNLPVILEVEKPEDEQQRRRIGFYERLGFALEDYEYVQPSLRPGEPAVPLRIMSYPMRIAPLEFNKMKHTLYKEVYATDTVTQPLPKSF